ncbi:MAG: DUF5916 domain-containing protein [candidate division WOR-3 bacterium]
MILLFLFLLNKDFLEVNKVDKIFIDGIEEEVWQIADSIIIEKQFYPYYDSLASYKTIVKVLQDKDNLYFLIKTDFQKDRPNTSLSGDLDCYHIYLDPVLSKLNAYCFSVNAVNERSTGFLLDDGRRTDIWEGVYDSKTKIYKDANNNYLLICEIKIPFKNFRYRKDINKWGFQIKVYYQKKRETCYFLLPEQEEGLRVSKFGTLRNVLPYSQGIGMEIYPVGVLKNEYYVGRDKKRLGKILPWVGLDIAYKKEDKQINLTFLPDFAEIESDPFTMTLGKYEIYYSERRHFFIEGKNYFEPATMGVGFYSPIKVFYSRRIGRKMRDYSGEVPILSGLKFTGRFEKYEIGFLNSLTGEKFGEWDTSFYNTWNVFRIKRYFFTNSEIGLLATHKYDIERKESFFNFDNDGALRFGKNQFLWQIVGNKNKNEKFGYAIQNGGVYYLTKNITTFYSLQYVSNNFDISSMGYANFASGDRDINLGIAYTNFPQSGIVSFYSLTPFLWQNKEINEVDWSRILGIEFNFQLRKPEIFYNSHFYYGKGIEDTIKYSYIGVNPALSFSFGQVSFWFGSWFGKNYNYLRRFVAWQAQNWAGLHLPILERVSLNFYCSNWIEFDTLNRHLSTTLSPIFSLGYKFTPYMGITFYSNPPLSYQNSQFTLFQLRTALYYYWEIKPKSKVYFVINEFLIKNNNKWQENERILAIKIKYFYWF